MERQHNYSSDIEEIQKLIEAEQQNYKNLYDFRERSEKKIYLQRQLQTKKLSQEEKDSIEKTLKELKDELTQIADYEIKANQEITKLKQENLLAMQSFQEAQIVNLEKVALQSEKALWNRKIQIAEAGTKFLTQSQAFYTKNEFDLKFALNKSFQKEQLETVQKYFDVQYDFTKSYVSNRLAMHKQMNESINNYEEDRSKEIEKITDKSERKRAQKQLDKEVSNLKKIQKLKESQIHKEATLKKKDAKKAKEYQEAEAEYKQRTADAAADKDAYKNYINSIQGEIFGKDSSLTQRLHGLKTLAVDQDTGEFNWKAMTNNMIGVLSNLAEKLDSQIDEISAQKGVIDTYMQGSAHDTYLGSYWDNINKNFTKYAGVSPYFSRKDLTNNLSSLVQQGITYNVEQRAFLETIKDKIAGTFDTTNSTLLRLVRIQQTDTTATRLGMESALTAFLNSMYETSEYMKSVATSVKSSLEETMSLMASDSAVSLEATVQKWMGSMYSVGMSESAVNNIASALGGISAGQIDSLTGNGAGNLIIMAANNAGISVADILSSGLEEESANNLLASVVEYLADLYLENQESRVVQQQIASVFGVTASDLKAAVNLVKENTNTLDTIFKTSINYNTSNERLSDMLSSVWKRTSTGEMMSNTWDNFLYTMSAGIANSPTLNAIYKIGSLMEQTGADVNIPFISAFGTGVDINATVSQLMRGGALATSFLSGMGSLIVGGSGGGLALNSSLAGLDSDTLSYKQNTDQTALISTLNAAGLTVDENATRKYGGIYVDNSSILAALGLSNQYKSTQSDDSMSQSGSAYIGNSSSADIKNATLNSAQDDANKQLAEAKESEENSVTIDTVNENVVKIYSLLSEVVDGTESLSVKLSYDATSQYTGWS